MIIKDDDILADMGRAHVLLKRRFNRVMMEHGSSLTKARTLDIIKESDGRVRAADLAENFGTSPRTVTEALDGLEQGGLIRRIPDHVDRRVKRLEVTPDGERAVAATRPVRTALAEEIMSVLSDEEKRMMSLSLNKMLQVLSK